jgi:hypothetical protein
MLAEDHVKLSKHPALTLIQTAAEYGVRQERTKAELVEAMDKILREFPFERSLSFGFANCAQRSSRPTFFRLKVSGQ